MNKDIIIKRTVRKVGRSKNLHLIIVLFTMAFSILTYGQVNPISPDSGQYVEGIVRNAETNMPIASAQIQTLNNEAAATTDEDGNFSIEIASTGEVLLVKAYNYNSREISVRGGQNMEIDLYPEVFTNPYQDIEGLTGQLRTAYATNAIRGTDDMGSSLKVSIDEVIQTSMGGDVRTISSSGVSGIGSRMYIRGFNSLNLNSQPLVVVDGVIWKSYHDVVSVHDGFSTNSLADIDVNDIESVSVIKDGTSIYGSKGSNGVIIIKTRRGKDMATKIVVNAVGGIVDRPASLPVMNGDQYRLYITDLLGTANYPAQVINEMGFLNDDPTDIDYKTYHNLTNWDDQVYEQGNTQSYNIKVDGGDDIALYAFSIGYTGDKGVVKSTEMQRLNTRFNADFSLTNRIKMGLNVGFSNIDRFLLDDGVNFYTSPTYLAMTKAAFLNPYHYTASGTLTNEVMDSDDFDVGNPTAIIEKALNSNKHYRLNLGVKPEIQLSPSLSISTLFDYSLDKVKETYYSPIIGVADRNITGLGISENVFIAQQMRNVALFDETSLQYKHQFGSRHNINAIAGFRFVSNNYELDYAEGHNSGSDQKRNLLNEQDFRSTDGLNNEIKSITNFINADYNFDKRYFLTATLAMDGSSQFGHETQGGIQMFGHSWGIFPSVNAAWLASSENFLAGAAFIDRLKIRGGIGVTGNDAIDPYAWTPYFSSINYMDRANGLIIGNIANREIQWETSTKLSLGLDANLFNDRLALSADIYDSRTKDLLSLRSLPEIAGGGYYWHNGGELSNKGFEISANAKMINIKLLKWEVGASIGHYKNRIEALPDGDFTTSIYGADILSSVGEAAGVFYGYTSNGVFSSESDAETEGLIMYDLSGEEQSFGAGDVHFVDQLADGIIDENDKQIIGDPNPDLYGSFNSKIKIWEFTIDAFFTFSYGNDIYNYLRAELESGSDFINQTTAMLNRWSYEGHVTNQPKIVFEDPMGNSRFSDRWIEDGSYLRLKSLSINYKIPVQNSIIDGITVWVSANNLWTLTNYLGRDPEVSARSAVLYQGIDTGLIPVCKSYFVGIKMNL